MRLIVAACIALAGIATPGGAQRAVPDTATLRAGAVPWGVAPGQRIRYAMLNWRRLQDDRVLGVALDTLWLESGERVPLAGLTLLEVRRGRRWSRVDVRRARAVANGIDPSLADPSPEQRTRHALSPVMRATLDTVLLVAPSREAPLVIVRARSSLPTVRWLGGVAPERRVAAQFAEVGYRTVVAPVGYDTLGVGDDGLSEGHTRLALDLTDVPLGGVAPPDLGPLRARLGALAPGTLLAVCDHVALQKSFSPTAHWECSIFDVASGRLVFAGAGEMTSGWRPTEQLALERALSGFLVPRGDHDAPPARR